MNEMDTALFNEYWEAITFLEAQEHLLDIQASVFPHMKKEARVRTHKDIAKMAKPKLYDGPPEEVTIEKIVAKITGAKIPPQGVSRGS